MKKLICVSLSALLVFLCSCSLLQSEKGFVLMKNIVVNKNENIISIDIHNDNALIFTSYANDPENLNRRILLYNMSRNRLLSEIIFDEKDFNDGEYQAEFIDDESFALCDVWENKASTYNLDMKLLKENISYTAKTGYDAYIEKSKSNPMMDDSYITYHTFATEVFGNHRLLLFYDDKENFYIEKYNDAQSIIESNGKNVLLCREEKDVLHFQVNDYASEKILNSADIPLTVPTEDDMTRMPYLVAFSEKFITVPVAGCDGTVEAIYYWNYENDEPTESFNVEKINYRQTDKYIEKAQKDFSDRYEIRLEINPKTLDDDKPLIAEKNKIKLYTSLLYIESVYDLLPKGMLREMYDYENGFDKMCVYLCKKIDDDFSDAYASNRNGENYIVYSTSVMNKSTVAHELMHAAEYRIWNECADKYDVKWEKLNPPDFYYVGYGDYSNYDDFDEMNRYFARDYGRATNAEDKAVTFEYLFCYGIDDMPIDWDKDSPIYKKAKLLCKALREAYPSVKNAETPIWEKYFNETA